MLKKGTSHRILVNLNEFSEFLSNWYFWWKSRRAWQMWSWDQLMANDSITSSAKILLTLASHHHAVGIKNAAHFIPWKGSWNQGADADCEACNMGNISHRNCSVCCHHLRLVFQIFKTIPRLNHGLSWRILLWILFVWFSSCFIPYIFFTSHLPPISSPTCIRVCSMSCWDCSRTISTRCSQVFDTASARSCPGGWVTYPPGGLQVESELEDIPARLYLFLDCYHTKMQVTNNHKNDNITFWDFWGNNTYKPSHSTGEWCMPQASRSQYTQHFVEMMQPSGFHSAKTGDGSTPVPPTWKIFRVPMLLTQLR